MSLAEIEQETDYIRCIKATATMDPRMNTPLAPSRLYITYPPGTCCDLPGIHHKDTLLAITSRWHFLIVPDGSESCDPPPVRLGAILFRL